MGQWEKSISEGTHNGRPVWFFSYSGQIDFAFYKSNLELAEIVDVHTGEEAVYDSKKDLMETVNNPKDYYHKLYEGAMMDLLMYLRNPDAWKRKQAKVVEARRRSMIPEAKKYREAEAKRTQAQARARLERMALGKYRIEISHVPLKSVYANTMLEARKKAVEYGGFVFDNGTNTFLGRIDIHGGEKYWTTTMPMHYTPVNRDGSLKNMSGYTHMVMVRGYRLYFAKSLNEARGIAISILEYAKNDSAEIYDQKAGGEVGSVVKYRKPNGGFRYVWRRVYTAERIPLNTDGMIKRRV